MLKRKIEKELLKWKNNKDKKCLILNGPRQVGKTFIINSFGNKNYKNYYELNFFKNPEFKEIFANSLDINSIIKQLSLKIPDIILNKDTLLFFDEIQTCPNAITALKFLTIEKNFDVIASGSLLGLTYKEVDSFPVGYVDHMNLNSLDFEEFLWANGYNEDTIKILKEYFDKNEKIPDSTHNNMMNLLKEYIVVGGMPEAVQEFINTHNFQNVLLKQRDILEEYKKDIVKYADKIDKIRIMECFNSIPVQLAQDYKKFKYKLVARGARSKEYGGCLTWLYDAGMINFCNNLSSPDFPFKGYVQNDTFKIYTKDIGLLIAMLDDGTNNKIISDDLGIYKGAIYENLIADMLDKLGYNLYYFEYNSTLEIDFIINYQDVVTAIEVKSGDNTKSKSLDSIMNNWDVKKGIRLSSKNIGSNKENIRVLPLYMTMFL